MDTDSLRLFVLAAEKLNISAAGRQLGLASAVASARLAKLEHTLGADLLRRTTRRPSAALDDSSLKCRKLADDQRVLCASPRYLEQHGVPQHLGDLAKHHLIAFRDMAPKALSGPEGPAGHFDPRQGICRLVVDDGLSLKLATVAGAGISINSMWSIQREIAAGTLVRVLSDYEVNDHSALWLVYPKSNVLTVKVRVFMDFLLARMGQHPPWLAA